MNDSDPIVTKAPAGHTGFEVSAISRGLVSTAMVAECRVLHTKLTEIGLPMSLGEVYVKKGYLAPPQVEIIESELVEINADAIPGYVITDKIATGGMGAVYKARQVSMDRVVAIKVLLPKFAGDAEGRERFLREARAVARLSHPNVVAGIDVGEIEGIYYFVMEFLDGESMDLTLRRCGRLDWREATKIVRQIALALEHAQAFDLIHRDIKPSNIMLLKNGSAKLADLGLARSLSAIDSALTQSGMIVGSPAYLSPEQATADRDIDIRSDIYSLGLTYFEFISGERAHVGGNPVSILTALLSRDIALDKLAAIDVPNEVVAVVGKMARREPGQRYQTPRALIDDLDAILSPGGGAISALRPAFALPPSTPTSTRPWRWYGIVAGVLLGVGALAWWQLRDQRVEPATSAVTATTAMITAPATPSMSTGNVELMAMLDALVRAQALAPGGSPYHAELEGTRYSIDFSLNQRTTNIELDARDGSLILHSEEAEDHTDDVEICKVGLADAIRAAMKLVPERPIEAEILLNPGRPVVVVTLRDQDGGVHVVEVDGISGEAASEPVAATRSLP